MPFQHKDVVSIGTAPQPSDLYNSIPGMVFTLKLGPDVGYY